MPDTAFQLLNFTFDLKGFIQQSRSIILPETQRNIQEAKNNFLRIISRYQQIEFKQPPSIEEYHNLFMINSEKGYEELLTIFNNSRKIRKLAWCLSLYPNDKRGIINSQNLSSCIKLLNTNWRDSLYAPIFEALLQNWDHANANSLRKLLSNHIKKYSGKRLSIQILYKNRNYYIEKNGSLNLGIELANNKIVLTNVLKTLQLSDRVKSYSYFSHLSYAYTAAILRSHQHEECIHSILEFLEQHNLQDTSKKCLSKIILKLNASDNIQLQELVASSAFHLIGDPASSSDHSWQDWKGANQTDKNELKQARLILNEWISRQIIEVFFDKLAIDADRKSFWLQYRNKIPNINIYGSYQVFQRLKQNENIKKFINSRFKRLTGETGELCILEMKTNKYLLLEFSTKGHAFYAYKKGSDYYPDLSNSSMRARDFIRPEMNQIVSFRGGYLNYHENEGRFIHRPSWQQYLAWWLEKYADLRL